VSELTVLTVGVCRVHC